MAKQWDEVPHDIPCSLQYFDSKPFPENVKPLIQELKAEISILVSSKVQFHCVDYREFMGLCSTSLEVVAKDRSMTNFT